MAQAGLKALAQKKRLKVGHFIVEFATPGIGHIMKNAGCDFVLFDMEHSGFGFETVKSGLRYMRGGRAAGDRAGAVEGLPSHRARLRHGRRGRHAADGRHRPTRRRAILDGMKYYPDGGRGVALQVAHDHYRPGPVPEKLAAANKRTTFFAQIETADGVKNADAIAAVDGVDCLWVGHFDLERLARHSRRVRQSEVHQGDRPSRSPRRASTARRSADWRRRSSRASPSIGPASISSATPATSGCCRVR